VRRTALVTGGARGIGLAIVRDLLAVGHRVAIMDVDESALERATAELGGPNLVSVKADLARPEEIAAGVRGAEEALGALDILVNNAGISPKIDGRPAPFEQIDLETWNRVWQINVTAMLLTCQAVVPGMRQRGWGRVVNMASLAGRTRPTVAGAAYAASKSAVIGLTRAVAVECAGHGVTVNAIAPGRIDTPMAAGAAPGMNEEFARRIPVGRMGLPEEIAAAALYLVGERTGFVTGTVLDVNGGFFMA